MYTVTTHYAPQTMRFYAKYVCSCGHKMTRINSDYFTRSPFNTHTNEECWNDLFISTRTQKRKCPKCGASVVPKLDAMEQMLLAKKQKENESR